MMAQRTQNSILKPQSRDRVKYTDVLSFKGIFSIIKKVHLQKLCNNVENITLSKKPG